MLCKDIKYIRGSAVRIIARKVRLNALNRVVVTHTLPVSTPSVAHLLCHNVARRGGDAAQHTSRANQLSSSKATAHSQRQEQRRQHHQLDHSSHSSRLEVSQSFCLEACTNGKQARGLVRPATLERALSSMAGTEMCSMLPQSPLQCPEGWGSNQDAFPTLFEFFSHIAV